MLITIVIAACQEKETGLVNHIFLRWLFLYSLKTPVLNNWFGHFDAISYSNTIFNSMMWNIDHVVPSQCVLLVIAIISFHGCLFPHALFISHWLRTKSFMSCYLPNDTASKSPCAARVAWNFNRPITSLLTIDTSSLMIQPQTQARAKHTHTRTIQSNSIGYISCNGPFERVAGATQNAVGSLKEPIRVQPP